MRHPAARRVPFESHQFGAYFGRALVAQVTLFFQSAADNIFQLWRQAGVQPNDRNWIAFQNLVEDDSGAFAAEGQLPGRHLVQHCAKRKQITARVQFLRPRLFRRHVSHRTQRGTGTGQVFHVLGTGHLARSGDACNDLGKTEIKDLGVAALGDKNIRRLDVAMNDALCMRGVERIGDFDGQCENLVYFQRTAGDAMLQRHAIEKFHGNEGFAVLVVNFVDRADIGMIQRGGRLGFALKAAKGLRVFSDVIGQELEGNKAVKLHILGFVDNPHAAATELLQDAVVRNGFANHGIALW